MRFKFTLLLLLTSFLCFSQTKSLMEVKRPEVLGLHFQKAGDSFKGAGAFIASGIIVSQLFKKKEPKISNIIGYGLGGLGSILI